MGKLLLIALVLVASLFAFIGCSAKDVQYSQTQDIRVLYSAESGTSVVIVPITLSNPNPTMLKEVTFKCHFSDESGTLLDTKDANFQLVLDGKSDGNFELEFTDVKGAPTNVDVLVTESKYENIFVTMFKTLFDIFFGWLY